MSTWLDIITDAYAEVGASARGEALNGGKSEEGRRLLNRMLGQWRAQKRFVTYLQQLVFTLTTATSYTIGPEGSILPAATDPDFVLDGDNDTRPIKIERANVRQGTTTPYTYWPLDIIEVDTYAEDMYRETPGTGNYLYYQKTFPAGTIILNSYIATTPNSLELFVPNQLVSIDEDELAEDAVLDDGYEDALIRSLAERVQVLYPGRANAEEIIRLAREARSVISSMNTSPPRLDTRL